MRKPLLFLFASACCVVACSSSDDSTHDNAGAGASSSSSSSGGATDNVDRSAYEALFAVAAKKATNDSLEGLWQVIEPGDFGGDAVTARVRFDGKSLVIAVKVGDTLLGVTTGYEIKSTTNGDTEIVLATRERDARTLPHGKISASTESGTRKTGRNSDGNGDYAPFQEAKVDFAELFAIGYVPNDQTVHGLLDPTFEKIGD